MRWPLNDRIARMKTYTAVILIIIACLFLRLPIMDVPFERDEGGYAYAAWRMMEGEVLYRDVFDLKPPGVFVFYLTALLLFGHSVLAIHIMLTLFVIAGAVFLFLIGRELKDSPVGMLAAFSYLVFCACAAFPGSSANTEHFMNTAVIMSVYFLIKALKTAKAGPILCCGALNGIAFLIKQPAVVNVIFAVSVFLAVSFSERRPQKYILKMAGVMLAGFFVPVIISVAAFAAIGALKDYIFCTYLYSASYSSLVDFQQALKYLRFNSGDVFLITGPLFAVSLASIFYGRKDRVNACCVMWLVFSILGVSIGFVFRRHYFLQIIPALSLLFAYGLRHILERYPLRRPAVYFAVSAVVLMPALASSISNYGCTPESLSKLTSGRMNPFVESVRIAEYIKENTSAEDTILVIGSEPQVYFYSKRRSAARYMYFYPLLLPSGWAPRMQNEAMAEIRRNKPAFIININERFSLLINKKSHMFIMKELNRMVQAEYEAVGCAGPSLDLMSSYYFFDEEFELVKHRYENIMNISLSENKPKVTIYRRMQ
ncbi:ArnT family glycosyltransferase [Candidatus Omnitrophota bacterium]